MNTCFSTFKHLALRSKIATSFVHRDTYAMQACRVSSSMHLATSIGARLLGKRCNLAASWIQVGVSSRTRKYAYRTIAVAISTGEPKSPKRRICRIRRCKKVRTHFSVNFVPFSRFMIEQTRLLRVLTILSKEYIASDLGQPKRNHAHTLGYQNLLYHKP